MIEDFLTCFEAKDADHLASFLHPDVVFLNYGDPEVRGKNAVRETWGRLFSNFGALRFETVHQAVNGDVIIAEQIHNIALPSGNLTPIMNMAIYEIVDGKLPPGAITQILHTQRSYSVFSATIINKRKT